MPTNLDATFPLTDEEFVKRMKASLLLRREILENDENLPLNLTDFQDMCNKHSIDAIRYYPLYCILGYLDNLLEEHKAFNQIRIAS